DVCCSDLAVRPSSIRLSIHQYCEMGVAPRRPCPTQGPPLSSIMAATEGTSARHDRRSQQKPMTQLRLGSSPLITSALLLCAASIAALVTLVLSNNSTLLNGWDDM